MTDIAALYAQGRGRIAELIRDADPDTPVPACPQWTVRDLVAHLTGICDDILNGRLAGVATEPWTAAQVQSRKDRSIPEILAEWDEVGPKCEAIAQNFGPAATQWLSDLTVHEHDLRTALGRPGARDSEAVAIAFRWLAEGFGGSLGGDAVRFMTTQGDDVVVGTGEPDVTMHADRYELFRALTGRRSRGQIQAMVADGDPVALSFEWGPFRPAAAALTE